VDGFFGFLLLLIRCQVLKSIRVRVLRENERPVRRDGIAMAGLLVAYCISALVVAIEGAVVTELLPFVHSKGACKVLLSL